MEEIGEGNVNVCPVNIAAVRLHSGGLSVQCKASTFLASIKRKSNSVRNSDRRKLQKQALDATSSEAFVGYRRKVLANRNRSKAPEDVADIPNWKKKAKVESGTEKMRPEKVLKTMT